VWVLFLNADGTVNSHQKISDTQGGFSGILDDVDFFGRSVASLGDLNGDGVADLAVGATSDGDGGTSRGAVWVLFLNADGTVNSHQKISDTQGGFSGILDDEDFFGRSVASHGDLNGDGIADLTVGATGDDDGGTGSDRGAVWVLFLNADGTVNSHQKISDTQGGFSGFLDGNDVFGVSVASLGDLNADGIEELAVGALGDDDGGTARGAVWILSIDGQAPAVCGDNQIAPAETCDDGNTNSGDGCYETCQVEDEIEFLGIAQGGTIIAVLNGTVILIVTTAGQDSTMVASNLADAINLTPALQMQGISSLALASRVVSDGVFDSVTSNDPGIFVPEPGMILMLGVGVLALAMLNTRSRRQRAA
jgi:cysteine-rich repeat protein